MFFLLWFLSGSCWIWALDFGVGFDVYVRKSWEAQEFIILDRLGLYVVLSVFLTPGNEFDALAISGFELSIYLGSHLRGDDPALSLLPDVISGSVYMTTTGLPSLA